MRVLLRLPTEPPVPASSDRPIDFHRRLPGYAETPLVEAPRLAELLGVAKVFVAKVTSRFGLPSFKVLGASWATYAALRERLGPIADGPLSDRKPAVLGSAAASADAARGNGRQSWTRGGKGGALARARHPHLHSKFRGAGAPPGD